MTLQEAKIADQFLLYFITYKSFDDSRESNSFRGRYNRHVFNKYMSLLKNDNIIEIEDVDSHDVSEIPEEKLTDYGSYFYHFLGGYEKKVKLNIEKKKAKKRKEYFEITKDTLLILLSLLSLYLGAF